MKTRFRRWLDSLTICSGVLLALAFSSHVAVARPNVILILADDLGWSDLGCYGNSVHETPHIDRLAAEGMRFTQAYSPAPICSASRAAILTGKTPARLGFEFVTKDKPGRQTLQTPLQSPPYTLDLPLGEETIGELLQRAGYRTGFFGKWHLARHHQGYLGWSPTHGPLQQGFEVGDPTFGAHPYAYREHPELKQQLLADGEYPEDELTDRSIEFIQDTRDGPFFLYLSHYFVHDPIHTRSPWLAKKYRQRLPTGAPEVRCSYAAMVETLDHHVGRVLAALDDAGLADETVVILTSDNGGHPNYTSNAPLRGSKWNLYEGGIRVPCLVRWPEHVRGGSVCHHPVHGCDLLPTLCGLAGVTFEAAERDGFDWSPCLSDPERPLSRKEPLVWHFPYYHPERGFASAPPAIGVGDFVTSQTRPHAAIRLGRWKLLSFEEDGRSELYDLESDTAEQQDVAVRHPEITSQLRRDLDEYLTRVTARRAQP
ncbi:MAG: sulfatase [Planctomycetaceae bacterium]|nr:sulfatase [Planctomycetaceae bacterium]